MPSWIELWNKWEIQTIVAISFSLQVILFFLAGIRRYSVSSVLKILLWLVYLFADLVATYGLGHMSSSLSNKSTEEHKLVLYWAPCLLMHLGGQDTITAYALEDNKLWLRHLLNMLVQVAATTYVLYKYMKAGGAARYDVYLAMWLLVVGVVKYGERIWALKLASKKGPKSSYCDGPPSLISLHMSKTFWHTVCVPPGSFDPPIGSNQFETYVFTVMRAHVLCHVFLKLLIIDGNEILLCQEYNKVIEGHVEGITPRLQEEDAFGDASAVEKRHTVDLYTAIEVELALMYDILYTKAQVVNTFVGLALRFNSLMTCFAALVVFTKGKRDGYSTPDIVITFALLCGACALEVASAYKAIGSTWIYAKLRDSGWGWLANVILFVRYHLIVIKDGRWSNSIGQFNFASFCRHNNNYLFIRNKIHKWTRKTDLWDKALCTKHAKLSPNLKEFVWGILKGDKRHVVRITDIQRGYWARKFSGIDQIKQLDWSMISEFHESVLIWHIATGIFLSNPAVKPELVAKDMSEEVNTLSDYMMYLLVKHPDILPINPDARSLFDKTSFSCKLLFLYDVDEYHHAFLDFKGRTLDQFSNARDIYTSQGEAVVVKAGSIARTMLDMELGLADKIVIIGTVWTEMLCYAATNATEGFHARQLSNGGEFLTHILLLTKYSTLIGKEPAPSIEAHESVESSAGHVELNVYDDSDDKITKICPI